MKKHIALLLALGVVSVQAASTDYPVFELWNKTDKPVYFAAASDKSPSNDKVMSEPLAMLAAGKRATVTSDQKDIIDMNKYTRLLITQDPESNTVMVYTFTPDKYMWVRVKEEKGQLVFGPQTGPLMGFLGNTEKGYPLDKNVKPADIKTQTLTRSFAQKAKKGVKGAFYKYTIGE
jgi:hypothetical protein